MWEEKCKKEGLNEKKVAQTDWIHSLSDATAGFLTLYIHCLPAEWKKQSSNLKVSHKYHHIADISPPLEMWFWSLLITGDSFVTNFLNLYIKTKLLKAVAQSIETRGSLVQVWAWAKIVNWADRWRSVSNRHRWHRFDIINSIMLCVSFWFDSAMLVCWFRL